MILDILKDHNVHTGTIGVTLTLAAKWIFDNISPIMGLIAAFGGVIVVILSIKEKIKKNRLLDLEIREKEKELNT